MFALVRAVGNFIAERNRYGRAVFESAAGLPLTDMDVRILQSGPRRFKEHFSTYVQVEPVPVDPPAAFEA